MLFLWLYIYFFDIEVVLVILILLWINEDVGFEIIEDCFDNYEEVVKVVVIVVFVVVDIVLRGSLYMILRLLFNLVKIMNIWINILLIFFWKKFF